MALGDRSQASGSHDRSPAQDQSAAHLLDERSQARVLALQALCLFDALGDHFGGSALDTFLRDPVNYNDLGWAQRPRARTIVLARELADSAWRDRDRADGLLREHVPDWSIERMQPVDRNILRLGLFELLDHPHTPHQVVINEAIDLARHFGGNESAAFVNGVLDGVRKAVDAFAASPAAETETRRHGDAETNSDEAPAPDD